MSTNATHATSALSTQGWGLSDPIPLTALSIAGPMLLVAVVSILLWFLYRLPTRVYPVMGDSRELRRESSPTDDVYVSSTDIDEMVHFIAESPFRTDTDPQAAIRHPGWSTQRAVNTLSYADVVRDIKPARVLECEGVWLRPSGVVLVVQPGQDRFEVRDRARRADEAGAHATHIYLSRDDVYSLAHHNFYIPINRGYHRRHVAARYPGWTWEELHGVLQSGGLLFKRNPKEWWSRHLPDGAIGVLISRSGTAELDDGSLDHTAKTESWGRDVKSRLSEHCERLGQGGGGPVIIHAPHTSIHIPAAVRSELLLDDDALQSELADMTDAGVADVLSGATWSNAIVLQATMSRLVFDPERFADGDPMESKGMGPVYTKCADGSTLRKPLTTERLAWYRAQHQAYTESVERVVQATVDRFGTAVIIDLHSYPAIPLRYEDPTSPRPEVCIGIDPHHTPAWLAEAVKTKLARFDTAINTPFRGTYVPGRWHQSDEAVCSVMLEVRRDVLESESDRERIRASLSEVCEAASTHITAAREGAY